jgi:hypothetical protein
MSLKLFGLLVLLCFGGVQSQTPDQFETQFFQFMNTFNQSLFEAYDAVPTSFVPIKQSLVIEANYLPILVDYFSELPIYFSDAWTPSIKTIYDEEIASAKEVLQMNAAKNERVINRAFLTTDTRARNNLTTAFNTFYNQSYSVFQKLYAGLSNSTLRTKTSQCIQFHWNKVEAAAKTLNTTIPNCIAKTTYNLAPVTTYINQGNTILNSKFDKFAACADGVNASSPQSDIDKAVKCIDFELELMQYTASQASDPLLMTGISTQNIVTAQEFSMYTFCLLPIFNYVASQMATLIYSVNICMM